MGGSGRTNPLQSIGGPPSSAPSIVCLQVKSARPCYRLVVVIVFREHISSDTGVPAVAIRKWMNLYDGTVRQPQVAGTRHDRPSGGRCPNECTIVSAPETDRCRYFSCQTRLSGPFPDITEQTVARPADEFIRKHITTTAASKLAQALRDIGLFRLVQFTACGHVREPKSAISPGSSGVAPSGSSKIVRRPKSQIALCGSVRLPADRPPQ